MKTWYINNFAIQILLYEVIYFWRLPKRKGFWFRLIPLLAGYGYLSFIGGRSSFPSIGGWFSLWYIFIVLLSALIMVICFKATVSQAIFFVCVAHTLQHMGHCMSRVFFILFNPSHITLQIVYLCITVVQTLLSLWFLRNRFDENAAAEMKRRELILFAFVSSIVVYYLSVWTRTFETETVGLFAFDAMSCAMILIILLDLFRYRKAERDNLIMMRVLSQEQEQHRISKEMMEAVNRKCHDLKHQVSALRSMSHAEQEESISELENAVLIYDNLVKSGNERLDIVLAEKSLLCEQKGIQLRCIADGSLLDFMKTEDLYSLIGNALDNAIEATEQEEEPGRRIITLRLQLRDKLQALHVENPSRNQPVFLEGLPVTTKEDDIYHGFGLRNMKYITEKYGGTMTASWEDQVFYLDILFSAQG